MLAPSSPAWIDSLHRELPSPPHLGIWLLIPDSSYLTCAVTPYTSCLHTKQPMSRSPHTLCWGMTSSSHFGSNTLLRDPWLSLTTDAHTFSLYPINGFRGKKKEIAGSSDGKELAYNAGDLGLIPGSGRFPGEGNGNPLQCSCLGNPMDRGAWWAAVHGVPRVEHNLVTESLPPGEGR